MEKREIQSLLNLEGLCDLGVLCGRLECHLVLHGGGRLPCDECKIWVHASENSSPR